MKNRRLLLLIAAIALASCIGPPPAVVPRGEARYLIDPRIGWAGPANPALDRRFEVAWRYFLAGDFPNARRRIAEIRDRQPGYPPADLAEAALAIREGNLAAARGIVDRIAERDPSYTAAAVYEGELDIAENRIQAAYDRYRELANRPGVPPAVAARLGELQTRLFDQLYGAALKAPPADAVTLLHEALLVSPSASAARLLLAQKLIALRRFDDARHELDPLLISGGAGRPEVQEALAEIDVGHGRYQEAIVRYERLSRRDSTGRYARRLDEIKDQFAAANLPPQVLQAINAETLSRADLAVLMYWNVAAIRFAQNVPTPPIAIDISDSPDREEIVRAIALGMFQVDPVTRRVNPDQVVNGAGLARVAARILNLGSAACARQVAPGSTPDAILNACGLATPALGAAADFPVSGKTAAALLTRIDQATSR